MLTSLNLNDKTYEELLAEAVAQIPLYSKEWTNFNVSDPGITTLQNLTAFQMLQQEAINDVPEEVLRKLLKLAGYSARENRAAEILVQVPARGGAILQEGHQLWSGDIPFETMGEIAQSAWGIAAIYSRAGDEYRDITRLLDSTTETAAYPFGQHPGEGDALVCVLAGIPEVGEPLKLWLQVAEEELRTPFTDADTLPVFAKMRWQYYTEMGWQDARFEDETAGLLRSGAITLWLEEGFPAKQEELPVQGCALRCLIDSADYDRSPRLHSVAAHLFPMVQQETKVCTVTADGGEYVEVRGRLPQLGNLFVYCRESEDGPYYRYREAPTDGVRGRYYRRETTIRGQILHFDPAFGTAPLYGPDTVKITCTDDEMIHHRVLSPVYGYDRQIISLDLCRDVLPDDFLLAVEERQKDGGEQYRFVAPGEKGPDGFSYHVRSRSAEIVIDDPGAGGYVLYLAGCRMTRGARGNLRPAATLEQRGGYDGTEVEETFFCPAPGRGGVTYESVEDLRLRFSAGMRRTSVAVRAEDYEKLVREIPGLCIDKVKAEAFGDRNLVRITIKPHAEEKYPGLTEGYLDRIRTDLEKFRMLTTRVELLQPRYVPVGISVTLSIRGMAEHAREETEEMLRLVLDHVNGEQNFGEWVRFNEIYQKLKSLPFVQTVDSLNLLPEDRGAERVGSDIRLDSDCLCRPGRIHLTFRERIR